VLLGSDVLQWAVHPQACIHSLEDALACCEKIGYPIMLKASWGGGGKGIRKVSKLKPVF
jgi:acetyl-CoA carboxylase / biotin carboxylase 1